MNPSLCLSQLVCSRLCHDLAGAAGAVNAGLEILAEMGELDDTALKLATSCGHEMTRRLAFYRAAFGAGTGEAEIAALRKLAADFLSSGSVRLKWPEIPDGITVIDPVFAKLVLGVILIAAECLPRGGTIDISVVDMGNGVGMAVSAEGPDARLREDLARAMTPEQPPEQSPEQTPEQPPEKPPADISSRSVHAYVMRLLVLETASELEVTAEQGVVRFAGVHTG